MSAEMYLRTICPDWKNGPVYEINTLLRNQRPSQWLIYIANKRCRGVLKLSQKRAYFHNNYFSDVGESITWLVYLYEQHGVEINPFGRLVYFEEDPSSLYPVELLFRLN